MEDIKNRQKITLPPDWYYPLTTQKNYYRNPTLLKKDALAKEKSIKPSNNIENKGNSNLHCFLFCLIFNFPEHILKILKVKTGQSEYEASFGDLGGMIVQEQLHGKIVYPECTCALHNPQK